MANFRYHRGSLRDSMETLVDITDMEDLLVELNFNCLDFEAEILFEHVGLTYYGYDARLKEASYLVRVFNPLSGSNDIIGFINENIFIKGDTVS